MAEQVVVRNCAVNRPELHFAFLNPHLVYIILNFDVFPALS